MFRLKRHRRAAETRERERKIFQVIKIVGIKKVYFVVRQQKKKKADKWRMRKIISFV